MCFTKIYTVGLTIEFFILFISMVCIYLPMVLKSLKLKTKLLVFFRMQVFSFYSIFLLFFCFRFICYHVCSSPSNILSSPLTINHQPPLITITIQHHLQPPPSLIIIISNKHQLHHHNH